VTGPPSPLQVSSSPVFRPQSDIHPVAAGGGGEGGMGGEFGGEFGGGASGDGGSPLPLPCSLLVRLPLPGSLLPFPPVLMTTPSSLLPTRKNSSLQQRMAYFASGAAHVSEKSDSLDPHTSATIACPTSGESGGGDLGGSGGVGGGGEGGIDGGAEGGGGEGGRLGGEGGGGEGGGGVGGGGEGGGVEGGGGEGGGGEGLWHSTRR